MGMSYNARDYVVTISHVESFCIFFLINLLQLPDLQPVWLDNLRTTLRLSFRLTTQFERFLKSWVMTKRSSGPWVKELNENLWADELYGEENGATGGRRSSCCSTVTSD